jgi:hypothetical protein
MQMQFPYLSTYGVYLTQCCCRTPILKHPRHATKRPPESHVLKTQTKGCYSYSYTRDRQFKPIPKSSSWWASTLGSLIQCLQHTGIELAGLRLGEGDLISQVVRQDGDEGAVAAGIELWRVLAVGFAVLGVGVNGEFEVESCSGEREKC